MRIAFDVSGDGGLTITLPFNPGSYLDLNQWATHRFKLDNILDAYDAFVRAAASRALEVLPEA
jgi:hypothetical protein